MKISKLLLQRGTLVLVFIAMLAVQTGCVAVVAGAAAGAGAVAYVRGELQANIDQQYDAVVKAANHALTELQFTKVDVKKDYLVAILEARTAEDTRVHIKVERSSETMSTVRIRIGLLGNEKLSRTILDKIKAAL